MKSKKKNTKSKKNKKPQIFFALFIFVLAFAVRLIFLLFFTKIEKPMVGDVWHHWQIAYLSKTVGFKKGFLRLWDFKGMEYYWGLMHPLILILGFIITGSVSIVIPRIISSLFSAGLITLIFLIVKRDFNKKAALASALFFIFIPTSIFHDSLGLQEPLGLFFLFLGVYLYPKSAFTAGFSWMLAGMTRAEYWVFGLALVLIVFFKEKNFDHKIINLAGYTIPCLFYLKYMLDHTGNPIYPVYWNFLHVTLGKWANSTELAEHLKQTQLICKSLAISFFGSGLIVFWKKPKSYLFLLAILANIFFGFFTFGFGAYLSGFKNVDRYPGFLDKVWTGKLLAYPWALIGILLSVFLLYFLPKKLKKIGTIFGTLIFIIILGGVQLLWPSINKRYLQKVNNAAIDQSQKAAEAIASQYAGRGKILLPASSEYTNYFLVKDQGVSGEKLVSTFYDPFHYYQGKDPFLEWDTFRNQIINWLQEQNAELLVVSDHEIRTGKDNTRDYQRMLNLEKNKLFKLVEEEYVYHIYKVNINQN